MKKALVLGVNGQDGSYLSEHLLKKGYDVYGMIRRSSVFNTERIDNIFAPEDKTHIYYGDLFEGIDKILIQLKPDLIFNTAAMSHVSESFQIPIYTFNINATGVLRILEGIKNTGLAKKTRMLQCSSSEMFGLTPPPQNEESVFHPVSPYGIAKLASYWAVRAYRDGYGMFTCNSICFNHESPRRGIRFVTRKIIRASCRIKLGLQKKLYLGNLDAKRDFGHSSDYCLAMILILENDHPDDYVISTEYQYSIKEFVDKVAEKMDFDLWKHIESNDNWKRPIDVPSLLGDSTKIRKELGWKPKYDFDMMIQEMVDSENEISFARIKGERMLKLKKLYEDKRGEIYLIKGDLKEHEEITIFTTEKGYARGGCIHNLHQEFCTILEGKVKYQVGDEIKEYLAGDTLIIPVSTPHYFLALTDCVVIEWGASPEEKKEKYLPFRQIVDAINGGC